MLTLDDARWEKLEHAYGGAGNIPALLRALASSTIPKLGFQEEPWFSLWSSLCHQGDVYTASYAAIPHIVRIASEADGPIDSSFFHLPAAVEVARQSGRGPDLPEGLANDYHCAIGQLLANVVKCQSENWDQSMVLAVAAAQAVAKGQFELAEALLNIDADWIAKINNCEFD